MNTNQNGNHIPSRLSVLFFFWLSLAFAPFSHGGELTPETALSDADLFHDEYQQDLQASLTLADRLLKQATPKRRPAALLYKARIQRLRGEFKSARLTLEQLTKDEMQDPWVQGSLLAERALLYSDRIGQPGGATNIVSQFLQCRPWQPDFEEYSKDYEQTQQEIFRSTRPVEEAFYAGQVGTVPTLFALFGITHTSLRHDLIIQNASIKELYTDRLATLRETELTLLQSAERGIVRYSRMLMPLLIRGWPSIHPDLKLTERAWLEQILKLDNRPSKSSSKGAAYDMALMLASCDQRIFDSARTSMGPMPMLQGAVALGCAERLRFPGSAAEELGLIVEPSFDFVDEDEVRLARLVGRVAGPNTTAASSMRPSTTDRYGLAALRSPVELTAARRASEQARQAFTQLNHRRGLARVAMSDAATLVMAALQKQQPPEQLRSHEAAEQQTGAALSLAEQSGDRRLLASARMMRIVLAALGWKRLFVQEEAGRLIAEAAAEEDEGALVGSARVLSAAATVMADAMEDMTAADLLFASASRLLIAAGAHIEAAHVHWYRQRSLERMGALEKSATVLAEAAQIASSSCESPTVTPAKLSVQMHIFLHTLMLQTLLQNERVYRSLLDQTQSLWPRIVACVFPAARQIAATDAAGGCDKMAIKFSQLTEEVAFWPFAHAVLSSAAEELKLIASGAGASGPPTDLQSGSATPGERIAKRLNLPPADLGTLLKNAFLAQQLPADESVQSAVEKYKAAFQAFQQHETPDMHLKRLTGLLIRCDVPALERRNLLECRNALNQVLNSIKLTAGTFTMRHVGVEKPGSREEVHTAQALLDVLTQRAGPDWMLQAPAPWEYLLLAAQLQSRLGHHDEARRLAREAISALELRRSTITDASLRMSFLDNTGTVAYLGLAVEVAANAGDVADTLEYIERGKARILQETMLLRNEPRNRQALLAATNLRLLEHLFSERDCVRKPSPACQKLSQDIGRLRALLEQRDPPKGAAAPQHSPKSPYDLSDIKNSLREDELLLDYFVSRNALTTVVMRGGRSPRVLVIPLQRIELLDRIRSLFVRLANNRDGEKELQQWLSSILLAPALSTADVQGVRRLIIVPHGELHRVPWAYLPDPLHLDTPLIKNFELQLLPYAGMLERVRQAAADKTAPESKVQIIAEPLDSANVESRAVAAQYAASQRVATPNLAGFTRALTQTGVLHVIAHGDAADRAGEKQEQEGIGVLKLYGGAVRVNDILLMEEEVRARVVVLASCRVGQGQDRAGDEQVGIPRALLVKGAGSIIGSLWRLPDTDETAEMMTALHTALASGKSGAEALTMAQRNAIKNGRPPVIWAGLTALGL